MTLPTIIGGALPPPAPELQDTTVPRGTNPFLASAFPDDEEGARDVPTITEGELMGAGWDRAEGEGW